MKQSIVAAAAAVAFLGGPALAADLPVRAPYYKAPQRGYFNWTGCYIGGHGRGGEQELLNVDLTLDRGLIMASASTPGAWASARTARRIRATTNLPIVTACR